MSSWKRILSVVLAICMLASMIPAAAAAQEPAADGEQDAAAIDGTSYFDFEASEYEANENGGEMKIKIVRYGEGTTPAQVALKAADFLSEYGKDYEILVDEESALTPVEGTTVDPSEFTYEGATEETPAEAPAEDGDEAAPVEAAPVKQERASTGSPLRDAQASYLDLPADTDAAQVESEADQVLSSMYGFFEEAKGAQGVVSFAAGETEKEITVRLLDNDEADGTRLFMLALMGTDTEETTIAPNASTYVSIMDDEDTEAATFTIANGDVTLSEAQPTAEITIVRSTGLQYFSTAYISTVSQTADLEAYESLSGEAVAFVPGQTEATVTVTANDFSQGGEFGIRLETAEGDTAENYYVTATIDPLATAADDETAEAADEATLMASNVTLGQANYLYGAGSTPFSSFPGGWSMAKTGSDRSNRSICDWNLFVAQYDKNCYTMLYTNWAWNFTGVKNVRFSMSVGGSGDGKVTYLELDSDQTFPGSTASYSQSGNRGWKEDDIPGVAGLTGNHYFKFAGKATKAGKHNPESWLDWFRIEYAKYSFSAKNSAETFNRKLYDFTEGTPLISDIMYDGESTRVYNPGTVTIKRGGDTVGAFYSNCNEMITITDANQAKNLGRGIKLKGVYFAASNITASAMYASGLYRTSNVYYVAADGNGQVNMCLTPDFVQTLINKGVLSSTQKDETINIYPVYQMEMATVNFENADRDDSKPSTLGKFDASHLNSYFDNILQACAAGTLAKRKHAGWLDYYSMQVPKGSVVRLSVTPASNRTPAGAQWWFHDGSGSGVNYFKKGDYIVDGTRGKVQLTQTDYTKAEIVVTKSFSVKPSTGAQSFYVGYSPQDKASLPSEVTSLKNAVLDASNGITGTPQASDATGGMYLNNAYMGKLYTITAFVPTGYYVSWANLTGDSNNDGVVNAKDEEQTIRNDVSKSSNPQYVYGNSINVKLDQDRTRYYYVFLPLTAQTTRLMRGTVMRENNTLLRLSNNQPSLGNTPVVGAYVSIAGSTAMTNGNGEYSIPSKGLPSWGSVSSSVVVDDVTYVSISSIERASNVVLNALEKFTARGVSAAYATGSNAGQISASSIKVCDDKLTITTKVSSEGAITATKAHFFIYDKDGFEKVNCDSAQGYTTTYTTVGNVLEAKLTFNAKQDLVGGDQIYVQYEDQNGTSYQPINVGYSIYAALSLKEFVFPMIGSAALENAVTTGFVADVIGDPLGGIDLGTVKGFTETSKDYTPAGVPQSKATQYTWLRTDYSIGWSGEFSSDSMQSGGDADAAAPSTDGNSEDGGYKTEGSFSWKISPSVGFKLTLSQRNAKNYFEDLSIYAKLGFEVSASQIISTPIGINVVVGMDLNGDVSAIYRMYTDYQDSYETEGAVPYDADNFGFFKKINNVRREGYIFLNPDIGVSVAVGVAIIYVKVYADFDFDMDFHFTEAGPRAYGDMTFDLDWGIELAGFKVYSMDVVSTTVELFHTQGTTGHIEYETKSITEAAENEMSGAMQDAMQGDEKTLVLDEPSSRAYLENRGSWQGGKSTLDAVSTLFGAGEVEGSTEKLLLQGSADNMQISLTPINDNGDLLMVFVDDDTARSNVNKRAVFYSVYKAATGVWSAPKIISDDGTMDDYPNVQDLGNGKIFVSWSSADKVLPNGATIEDALKALNIQATFFDTATATFGKVGTLTKTTEEDYTADVMPRASYDAATDCLMLYYTKTEYDDLTELADIGTAYSVTAYLFYQNGEWSNTGDAYAPEELAGMTEEEIASYKGNWYGQRFLDTRLNTEVGDIPRVVDADAISYNGLSLYAWTVDWDDDLNTSDDRDVFIQIYDFETNEFSHMIRVSEESGIYTTPKLVRSSNATYLLYGQQEADSNAGEIRYLNISNVIKNGLYTKVTNGANEYYVLEATAPEITTTDAAGNPVTIPAETHPIVADIAAECNNIQEFDTFVAADGKTYLIWTDSGDNCRNVYAAILNSTDGEDGEDINTTWSAPVALTDSEAGIYYAGLGVATVGSDIMIVSSKNSFTDEAANSMVQLKHTPTAHVVLDEDLSVSNDTAKAGDNVEVTATLRNEGLLSYAEGVNVAFKVNGEDAGTVSCADLIAGGSSVELTTSVVIPDTDSVELTAEAMSTKAAITLEKKPVLALEDQLIGYNEDESTGVKGSRFYSAVLSNNGNAPTEKTVFTAYVGETVIGTATVEPLEAGESANVSFELHLSDSMYTLGDGAVGTVGVTVKAVSGEDTATYTETLSKQYNETAVNLLKKVTSVDTEARYTLSLGAEMSQITPVINGVDEGTMVVDWQTISDGNVATIDYSNGIIPRGVGTATLTGLVIPTEDIVTFDVMGNQVITNWEDVIPENMQKHVTVKIAVTDAAVPFTDVSASDWFYDDVLYCYNSGLIKGTTATTFAPKTTLSRAMFVTILYRAAGSPAVTKQADFQDVPAGTYYTDAVAWAAENKIVEGFGNNTFKPNAAITREQMATIMYRQGTSLGLEPAKDADASLHFADTASISNWALQGVQYCKAMGLMKGNTLNQFNPGNSTTRCEAAAVIHRFEEAAK